MFNSIKNLFRSGYKYHPDAIIIACYFNPQRNEYRKKAFDQWYDSIKHLNHFILEAVPAGSVAELPDIYGKIEHVQVDQMLWHKETLLNRVIDRVIEDGEFEYIFWLDTDIIFDNKNWLTLACHELQFHNVIQPFEYCFHLEKDYVPENSQYFGEKIDSNISKEFIIHNAKSNLLWRSFGANAKNNPKNAMSDNYDVHGHVGFAWGARTKYLRDIGGLYDKALIGGADHIMAHAFVGQIPCECIEKSFGYTDEIRNWSDQAYTENGRMLLNGISYVKGNLFHIWHGDIEKREYYKRIKEFTPLSKNKVARNSEGFFQTSDPLVSTYFDNYLSYREDIILKDYPEMLHSTDIIQDQNFGGGQFGGSGAGGDWTDQDMNNTETYNPTFS